MGSRAQAFATSRRFGFTLSFRSIDHTNELKTRFESALTVFTTYLYVYQAIYNSCGHFVVVIVAAVVLLL